MYKYSLKQKLGVIIKDFPLFEKKIRGFKLFRRQVDHWTHIHNRNEVISYSPDFKGVICHWKWTSDLHACKVFPYLGSRLFKVAFSYWPIKFKIAPSIGQNNNDYIDISFIIGHKGTLRLPHLLATLRSIASQRRVSFECIVVEQSSNVEVGNVLPEWVRYIHTPIPHPEMPYCRSWAFNVGAREARGRLLVFHDNDVCAPMHYGKELIKLFNQGYKAMRIQRFVFYFNLRTTEMLLNDYRIPDDIGFDSIRQNCEGHTIAVDRETYFQIGGHDESFVGWGGEDNEFFQRCQTTKFYPYMYLPFIHLYHEPQPGEKFLLCRNNSELLAARSSISSKQRVAELYVRNFGNYEQLDPPFVPS